MTPNDKGSKKKVQLSSRAADSSESLSIGVSSALLDSPLDLRISGIPWERLRAIGKSLRQQNPREQHSGWAPANDRPNPLDLINASNEGRQKEFIPLRMGRMAATPFTFFRGAACVMAYDLKRTPVSGINVVIDGDVHVNNFGLYGTPQRDVCFDLNDFDETTVGPWEWDLKRLVASVNVAGRENGLNHRERATAVKGAVAGYRNNLERIQSMGVLDVRYLLAYPGRQNPLRKMGAKTDAIVGKSVQKAQQQTNTTLLAKTAKRSVDGALAFRHNPPILTSIDSFGPLLFVFLSSAHVLPRLLFKSTKRLLVSRFTPMVSSSICRQKTYPARMSLRMCCSNWWTHEA